MEDKKQNTTVTVSVELWKYLNDNRINPADTIEEVIWRFIIEEKKENDKKDI